MIIPAYPPKTPDHIGQMGAESPSVSVQFVDHHIPQIGKQQIKSVFAVVGQKGSIDHLRVGQNDIGMAANPAALGGGSISVIHPCRYPVLPEKFQQGPQRLVLVAGQRLSGIDEQGPGPGIAKDFLQHRQQKAQRLAAGRGGGDHHIFPLQGQFKHLCLMTVKPINSSCSQILRQLRQQRRRVLCIFR